MSYTIEHRGEAGDPYIVGDLHPALERARELEGEGWDFTVTEEAGWFLADDGGDHWGSGSTAEAATRYIVGAVLDDYTTEVQRGDES